MQTVEQMYELIQNLPEETQQQLFLLMQQRRRSVAGNDKWEKARQTIHSVAGSMDLGEQLVEVLDRETIYEERFE